MKDTNLSASFYMTIHRAETGSKQSAPWIVYRDLFIQQLHIATDWIFQLWHSTVGNSYANKILI